MVEVKEMPVTEKYERVLAGLKHDEFMPAFIEKHLGRAASQEFRRLCEEGLRPVPENASPEDKYEAAYRNWMLVGATTFGFVRERMGDEGLERLVAAGVEALERENSSLALYLLRMIRAVSPGLAFSMVAKQSAYELQWLTPYSVDELSRERAVMTIPRCKILDYPGSEDVCLFGCQRQYPAWMAEQFKVKLEFDRRGTSCTATVTPLQ
jgi:hypothetical protein